MGETAAVLGGRQWIDRQNGLVESDELLVAGVRAGDREAFEEIYDRYARGILAFCVHMLGSREAAEDALQQTFVSAYRSLQRAESTIALRPWLYTIARNRCLSELRARRDALGVDELVADTPVIDGLADQVQRREDLREMLDDMQRLPADQRAALVLFELGDHPQKDIATVLGVRTEKVKALVFQAREALVRGRAAREHPCRDIREQLATLERIPARSMLRLHIERCPGCQSFEHEVRHQRAALALILPVALTGELKKWILGSALHSSGAVAAGVGACGGGGGVAASACGGGAIVGGATMAGSVGGAGAISAATAGGIAGTGAGTAVVATGAPVVAAATGLTAVGETVGGLSATGVVAKILTAAAIATVAASSSHTDKPMPQPPAAPAAKAHHRLLASAVPLPGVRAPARDGGTATDVPPPVTGVPSTVTATPLGSPASAPSATSVPPTGATAISTTGTSTTSGQTSSPPATGTSGAGTGSSPLAASNAPAPGGASTAGATPAASSAGPAPSGSSGSSDTSAASTSSAPAAADPSPSPASDSTTSAATATTPTADSTGSGAASSPPSTAASDAASGATAATGSTAAAQSGASSSADGATAPSASSAATVQAATAAGPGGTDAASGLDASAVSPSGN